MSEDIDTIKERVRSVLQRYPSARDDKNMLAICYWKSWDNLKVWIENVNKLTPVESITRAARKIQNEDRQFMPTIQVKQRRVDKERQYREHYGNRGEYP